MNKKTLAVSNQECYLGKKALFTLLMTRFFKDNIKFYSELILGSGGKNVIPKNKLLRILLGMFGFTVVSSLLSCFMSPEEQSYYDKYGIQVRWKTEKDKEELDYILNNLPNIIPPHLDYKKYIKTLEVKDYPSLTFSGMALPIIQEIKIQQASKENAIKTFVHEFAHQIAYVDFILLAIPIEHHDYPVSYLYKYDIEYWPVLYTSVSMEFFKAYSSAITNFFLHNDETLLLNTNYVIDKYLKDPDNPEFFSIIKFKKFKGPYCQKKIKVPKIEEIKEYEIGKKDSLIIAPAEVKILKIKNLKLANQNIRINTIKNESSPTVHFCNSLGQYLSERSIITSEDILKLNEDFKFYDLTLPLTFMVIESNSEHNSSKVEFIMKNNNDLTNTLNIMPSDNWLNLSFDEFIEHKFNLSLDKNKNYQISVEYNSTPGNFTDQPMLKTNIHLINSEGNLSLVDQNCFDNNLIYFLKVNTDGNYQISFSDLDVNKFYSFKVKINEIL